MANLTYYPHFGSPGIKFSGLYENYQRTLNCFYEKKLNTLGSTENDDKTLQKMTDDFNCLETKALSLKKKIDDNKTQKSLLPQLSNHHMSTIADIVLLKSQMTKLEMNITENRSQFFESFTIFKRTCEKCRELLKVSNRIGSFMFVSARLKKKEFVSGKSIAFCNKEFLKFKGMYEPFRNKKSKVDEFDKLALALFAGCLGKLLLDIQCKTNENGEEFCYSEVLDMETNEREKWGLSIPDYNRNIGYFYIL